MSENFVLSLRKELLDRVREDGERQALAFNVMSLAAFRYQGRELRFSTRNQDFAYYLKDLFQILYGIDIQLSESKTQYNILIDDLEVTRRLREDMDQFRSQGLELFENNLGQDEILENLSICLSSLFLSCGSMADPKESYHLEFSLQRQLALDFFKTLFQRFDLDMADLKHQGYFVLYGKDGGTISNFLLLAKAHRSMLNFESLRVEKDMLNRVNRVVNCDNANAQRVADSSLKQRMAIRKIIDHNEFDKLSLDLQETAVVRMENPELSLSELGGLLSKPLGKSGVNHRLQKIMDIAAKLR